MIQRLRNLWAWSAFSPYQLGATVNQSNIEIFNKAKAEIVYPNRTAEILAAKPDATLDDLLV